MLNIVVRPGVYKRFRQLLRTAHLLVVTGTVQHEMGVTNVLANNIAQLDNLKNNGSQEG
jgi:error-prone DNA polymerase